MIKLTCIYFQLTKKPPKDSRKLFIGNLYRDTTNDDLKNYFEQWGTIVKICERELKPKYYQDSTFIIYSEPHMAQMALDARPHKICDSFLTVRPATLQDDSDQLANDVTIWCVNFCAMDTFLT